MRLYRLEASLKVSEYVAHDAVGLAQLIAEGEVSASEVQQVARQAITAAIVTLLETSDQHRGVGARGLLLPSRRFDRSPRRALFAHLWLPFAMSLGSPCRLMSARRSRRAHCAADHEHMQQLPGACSSDSSSKITKKQ